MAQGIIIEKYGKPDVLKLRDISVGRPCHGEVKIRHTLIGVNFHDTYVRSGQYQTLSLPGIPGIEATAEITEIGKGVKEFCVGDRVAYVTGEYGVYCTERLIDPGRLFRIPALLSDKTVASGLLRGLTTEMLMNRVYCVSKTDTILIQAAAGGMGQLLCRWASQRGASVIGTVRTDEQEEIAKAAGCNYVIRYKHEEVTSKVNDLTNGRGVNVVYDGVGRSTFRGSLESLSLCGHLINFGQNSGAIPPIDISLLANKSLTISRPIIFHYLKDPHLRNEMFRAVFAALQRSMLVLPEPRIFNLSDAAKAHQLIESQGASVPLLLKP